MIRVWLLSYQDKGGRIMLTYTIQRLGMLAHQICYRVCLSDGRERSYKTLAGAKRWATKQGATDAAAR